MIRSALITGLAALLLAGCGESAPPQRTPPATTAAPAPPAAPWFVDATTESNINFNWTSGQFGDYLLPEIIGGGVALLDVDGDNDLDIYLVQGGEIESALDSSRTNPASNRLYRNDGDWHFQDITEESGAGNTGYGQGVATGDYDNDGDLDLYVTNVGPNALLRNDGNGRFTDVTTASGTAHPGWGTSAAFLDTDRDGDLDLYITNYISWSPETELDCSLMTTGRDYCSPRNYDAPARDVLYENLGNGRFNDVTSKAGIDTSMGNGLGIACVDFDDDGWTDIFIANDGTRDLLWHNQRDGSFKDIGLLAGCALDDEGRPKAGMGVTVSDIDDDGDMDLLVCNLTGESDSLFRNEGTYFVDITASSDLRTTTKPFTRFGMAWLDFNNDGYLDLYEANGRVLRSPVPEGVDPYAQQNMLLRGSSQGVFSEVLPRGGVADPISLTSRAAAFGDLDNDGAMDIIVVNRDAPITLLRNIAPDAGHWILLQVLDEHGRDAIGAVVSARIGSRTLSRPLLTTYSYLAANDPRIHLGLGANESVDTVTIRWVDGTAETFGPLAADRQHVLQRGSGH